MLFHPLPRAKLQILASEHLDGPVSGSESDDIERVPFLLFVLFDGSVDGLLGFG